MNVSFETITPEKAKEYLKHNVKNRTVKVGTVASYARDILRGEFVTTHQGIAFNTEGELFDGQHRLLAVIAADTPVEMMVARDVPNAAVYATDRGVSRSVRDVFMVESQNSDNPCSDSPLTNIKVVSALNMLIECTSGKCTRQRSSVGDIRHVYDAFRESTLDVHNEIVTKSGRHARAPMLAAAIAAIERGVPSGAVSKFFDIFFNDDVTGCQNFNVQAALNWKRQIDAAKIQHVYVDAKKCYLGTQNAIHHFVSNTNVSKVEVPDDPVYDVSDMVARAIGIGVSEAA